MDLFSEALIQHTKLARAQARQHSQEISLADSFARTLIEHGWLDLGIDSAVSKRFELGQQILLASPTSNKNRDELVSQRFWSDERIAGPIASRMAARTFFRAFTNAICLCLGKKLMEAFAAFRVAQESAVYLACLDQWPDQANNFIAGRRAEHDVVRDAWHPLLGQGKRARRLRKDLPDDVLNVLKVTDERQQHLHLGAHANAFHGGLGIGPKGLDPADMGDIHRTLRDDLLDTIGAHVSTFTKVASDLVLVAGPSNPAFRFDEWSQGVSGLLPSVFSVWDDHCKAAGRASKSD